MEEGRKDFFVVLITGDLASLLALYPKNAMGGFTSIRAVVIIRQYLRFIFIIIRIKTSTLEL